MKTMTLIAMVLALCMVSSPAMAWFGSQTSDVITGATISLGNSTCVGYECDRAWVYFLLPIGLEKPQYVKFIINPACISGGYVGTYNVSMYCSTGYNKTIDLTQTACNPAESIVRWVTIENTANMSYQSYNGVTSEVFWCAFKRDPANTETLPTEFSVVVDTLGMTNEQEDGVLQLQRNSGATLLSGIGTIFTINFNAVQITFYLLLCIVFIAGFMIIIGGFPIMLKWIAKKVTGG